MKPAVGPVQLSALVISPEMQVRAKTDPGMVKRYARDMDAGAEFPPILVAELGGAFMLVDGFHRVAAMQALGIWQAKAEVFVAATLEEAKWRAALANLTHGLPLKARDFRQVFRAYVKASQHRWHGERGPLKSYREMAKEIGAAHTTIRNWMRRDFPPVFRAMGGDEGEALGGLPEREPPSRAYARVALRGVAEALAALAGVTDPVARGRLLEEVEALREAIVAAGVEADRSPF